MQTCFAEITVTYPEIDKEWSAKSVTKPEPSDISELIESKEKQEIQTKERAIAKLNEKERKALGLSA